jgi:cellulose synthase/poly-beta-1,6-N-acetylglucosamine synthase-like glycosyltransferase
MLSTIITVLSWIYAGITTWLALYSLNMLMLTVTLWVHKRRATTASSPPLNLADWPVVTVQIPLYNEQLVACRLIDAIAQIDYPLDRLYIQILDDSVDKTAALVDEAAGRWREKGRWISIQRRVDRRDYKAGALRAGLENAQGEFVVIFDADFVPPADWLKRALRPFYEPGGERLGLVQTRWSHLNDRYSLLTRAQALALDGHFGVEQNARHQAGLFMNFNGTAGIWRRKAIEDAGNWRGATLSEDLDLSYRAQLRGWKMGYLPDVTAPAELPTLMIGFKRQQFRWTKGSIQVLRLLGHSILTARISAWRKFQGLMHLSGYLVHPLMILLLIVSLPLSLWGLSVLHRQPLGWLGIVGLGPPLFYATSQGVLYGRKRWWNWFVRMPLLSMLGVGIAVNNTRAVLEGLRGVPSPFERTPKTGITSDRHGYQALALDSIKLDPTTWAEVLLSLYALATGYFTLLHGNWVGAFFFLLYATGFGWVAGATLWEERQAMAPRHGRPRLIEQLK